MNSMPEASPAAALPPHLGNAPLYALGVVTPNIETTTAHYQRVFGIVPEVFGVPEPLRPDGTSVALRMNVAFLPNFYIKLQQPITPVGPYADHLGAHGMSIQNLQFQVAELPLLRADMERVGGRWSLGGPDDFWAYVDFRDRLGMTLEPGAHPRVERPVTPVPGAVYPLGGMPVTHIGIAVPDASAAARAFAEVFGIPVPELHEERGLDFPVGSDWDEAAVLRVARWRQGEIIVELVETVGGATPWRAHVEAQGGSAVQYIAIDTGGRLAEVKAELEAKGGLIVQGAESSSAFLFDFMDTLGLFIRIA